MKRLCALLLAALLVLSIAPGAVLADDTTELTTVTIATYSNVSDHWADAVEHRVLKEKYGIVLQHIYAPNDKVGTMLAANDLCDIMKVKQQFISTVLENRMALNLDDYADQLPNLMSDTYAVGNEIFRLCLGGEEHALYFTGVHYGAEYSSSNDRNVRGYVVRWDLYKELGCPAINNDDDFIEVIKQMLALYPTTEAGLPVYGIGTYDNLSAWTERGRYTRGVATRPTFSGYYYSAGVDDQALYDGYTNTERSEFWTDMEFYNKCWREGILDPDSFTMTSSELTEKYKANQYVAARTRDNSMYNANLVNDPDTLVGFVMIPSPNQVIHSDYLTPTGYSPSNVVWIDGGTDNRDAALQVLDYYFDPMTSRITYNGVQGESWDYDENGKPYIFQEVLDASLRYGESSDGYFEATGILNNNPIVILDGSATFTDGAFANLYEQQENRALVLTNVDRDLAQWFGYETPSAYHVKLIDEDGYLSLINEIGMLVCMNVGEIPLDIQRIMATCNDILYANLADLVMAEDDEEFEAAKEYVLDELAAADEATAWEWCLNAYNESYEIIKPYFDAYQADYIENVISHRTAK